MIRPLDFDVNLPQYRFNMPTSTKRIDLALTGPPMEQRFLTENVDLLQVQPHMCLAATIAPSLVQLKSEWQTKVNKRSD